VLAEHVPRDFDDDLVSFGAGVVVEP